MGILVTTPPAVEPVSLTEAKLWARIDIDDDDTIVTSLIVAARQSVEVFLRRTLITTEWELTLPCFPGAVGNRFVGFTGGAGELLLPNPPLRSVESVEYIDNNGTTQTLPVAEYVVDTSTDKVAKIVPASDEFWPSTYSTINTVTVKYTAGYGSASTDVPDAILTTIKMMIDNMYEHRTSMSEVKIEQNPTWKALLWNFRAFQFDVEV